MEGLWDPPDTGSETEHSNFESPGDGAGQVQLILRSAAGVEVRTLGEGEEATFGRASIATVPIPDSRVSRLHTRIRVDRGAVWVDDLGSRNGTLVGRALLRSESRRAFGGDLVRIGPLEVVVARVEEASASESDEPQGIVIADPSMRHVFEVARRLSLTSTTVLITGETGSGKEVVAEQIHRWSTRKQGPFVRLSCAGLPASFWDKAAGGTLLLDEVGALSAEMQAKLLIDLDSPIDVRVLCSTHRDLEADVREGRFRQDLYYRINTFTLRVPPLRERKEEILLLANHYAAKLHCTLGVDACDALVKHRWPGNVRELRNALEHAMVLANDSVIKREHLPSSVLGGNAGDDAANLEGRLASLETQTIRDALSLERGNQTRAARRLGITRRALIYRMDRLGITKN
jgi:DNA-binding NtrC family response regulator